MLDVVSKLVAIFGVLSTAILGWLYFFNEVGFDEAIEAIEQGTETAVASPESAREALEVLGSATRDISQSATDKGYTDLPPILITEDPVWVLRSKSANWNVPGVGQISVGVNGFNGERAWVRINGEDAGYHFSGAAFPIDGSTCNIFLEAVDEPDLRAGFRMSCP